MGLLGGGGPVWRGLLDRVLVIAISGVVAAWLAALIVGVELLAVAGAAALLGKGRLHKATPPVPKEAVSSPFAGTSAARKCRSGSRAGRRRTGRVWGGSRRAVWMGLDAKHEIAARRH